MLQFIQSLELFVVCLQPFAVLGAIFFAFWGTTRRKKISKNRMRFFLAISAVLFFIDAWMIFNIVEWGRFGLLEVVFCVIFSVLLPAIIYWAIVFVDIKMGRTKE